MSKRSEGLHVITRRGFCGSFASCVGLALAGCTDGNLNVVQTGGLNGSDGEGNGSGSGGSGSGGSGSGMVDAGVSMHDAGGTMHDAGGMAATCPTTGATDVGAPSSFTLDHPVYNSSGNFFVVRDSGGLYALSARCTHQGVTVVVDTGEFFCPAHGATFDFDGNVTGGPALANLVHYAMCTLSNGHVGVVKSQIVSQSQRLMA